MPVEITESNFDSFVLKNDKPVLVDFWASWCGTCRMLGPVVDQLAEDYQDSFAVGKINVDEQSALAERFKVMSIPTLYFFKGGEVAEKLVGARPAEEIKGIMDRLLAN